MSRAARRCSETPEPERDRKTLPHSKPSLPPMASDKPPSFAQLGVDNYATWAVRMRMYLVHKGLGHTVGQQGEGAEVSADDSGKALACLLACLLQGFGLTGSAHQIRHQPAPLWNRYRYRNIQEWNPGRQADTSWNRTRNLDLEVELRQGRNVEGAWDRTRDLGFRRSRSVAPIPLTHPH